ncbi:hypothetical protein [Paraburkholderia youngii]|uniref:hypothetical protein n=1 Tax=Paraburkholderia youngii TaxID=2782701 RepID=UPI003D1C96AC
MKIASGKDARGETTRLYSRDAVARPWNLHQRRQEKDKFRRANHTADLLMLALFHTPERAGVAQAQASYFKARIEGYVISLQIEAKRFTCEVSREGYRSSLERVLKTSILDLNLEHGLKVDPGSLRAIREWVISKHPPAGQKRAKLPDAPRAAGRPHKSPGRPRETARSETAPSTLRGRAVTLATA